MSEVRTVPWESIADWFAKHEQTIRDVMKFEGLRGAVNEVLRLAPDQPELAALREELASLGAYNYQLNAQYERMCESQLFAEQRNAELEKDAARYQWLRDKSESVHQFYLSTPIWFTGVKFNKENVDRTIDAALNPNPEAASHDE